MVHKLWRNLPLQDYVLPTQLSGLFHLVRLRTIEGLGFLSAMTKSKGAAM